MANEPNKPDEIKTAPANETPKDEKSTPINKPLEVDTKVVGSEVANEKRVATDKTQTADEKKSEQQAMPNVGGEKTAPPEPIAPKNLEAAQNVKSATQEQKPEQPDKRTAVKAEKMDIPKNTSAEKSAPKPEKAASPPKATTTEKVVTKPKEPMSEKTTAPTKAQKPEKQPKPKTPPKPKPEKSTKEKQGDSIGGGIGSGTSSKSTDKATTHEVKAEIPYQAQPQPPEPKQAPRSGEAEKIVYISLAELYPFKDHPFQVKQDAEMKAMVESVADKGVTQAAVVRPREGGGYEMVSGHRRQMASELAGFTNMPCIIRNLTDEQAITQMVEDNTTQRESILPSERANALKMQLEAIKRQGAREDGSKGQRSNEIVADRNKMTSKQVQRYIKLTELVPDLLKMVDEKKIGFTPAIELAFIKPKNQRYIAVAIEGQQSAPSLSQAQRMRELDQKNVLNPDMIDGIMLEEKKEVDKVILSSQELSQFFGKDKTPREMKDTILKLLDEYKTKQPPELSKLDNQIKNPER